jgi:ribosomal protein L16/L10AE
MGGGKGSHDSWNAVVSKGKVLLEFEGLNFEWSLYLYNEINNRLPIKTKLIFLK